MEILTDPKVAPLIWMLPLLAFCWVMFHQLTNNPESHIWWVGLLSKVKLADKGTTEYEHPVNASKLIFKWLAVMAGILVLYQTFLVIQQYNPYLVGGPQPTKLTGAEGMPGKLPPRIPGAGGGGKSGSSPQAPTGTPGIAPDQGAGGRPGRTPAPAAPQGQPGGIQPGGGQPGAIQPGGGQPGIPGQPGMQPGGIQPGIQPGAPGAPAASPGMQPGTPINPMGGPVGTGGGGRFNPNVR